MFSVREFGSVWGNHGQPAYYISIIYIVSILLYSSAANREFVPFTVFCLIYNIYV